MSLATQVDPLLASLVLGIACIVCVHRAVGTPRALAAAPAPLAGIRTGGPEVPRLAALTQPQFEALVIAGHPFIVTDYAARLGDWPMARWTCDEFARRFPNATVVNHLDVEGGDSTSSMQRASDGAPRDTGCADPRCPRHGPVYWGIKEAGYAESDERRLVVPPSEARYLREVQRASRLPYFLGEADRAEFLATPEVWLSRTGAGAQAHADAHCGSTVSLQVAGEKRWRLGPMWEVAERRADRAGAGGGTAATGTSPDVAADDEPWFSDGAPYAVEGGWNASFEAVLRPGEALVFPPSFVHETVTTSEGCAVSVTHQLDAPPAAGRWHAQLRALRRAPDMRRCWARYGALYWRLLGQTPPTPLGQTPAAAAAAAAAASPRSGGDEVDAVVTAPPPAAGAVPPAAEVAALMAARFRALDGNGDGCLRLGELPSQGPAAAVEVAYERRLWQRVLLQVALTANAISPSAPWTLLHPSSPALAATPRWPQPCVGRTPDLTLHAACRCSTATPTAA